MDLADVRGVLDELGDVTWYELAVALAFYVSAIALRGLAWRNVLADDFPEARVSYPRILGAYTAGIGVNSVLPFRIGDVVKLFLARRFVAGSTYPALVSTLFVLALLDAVFALGYVSYAVATGALPGFDVLVSRPGWVGAWLFENPWAPALLGIAVVAVLLLARHLGRATFRRFGHDLARGFAVLRDWPFYPLHVASWQGLGWVLELGAFWWFLRAFDLTESLRGAALVQAVQSISMALPFTASGAGAEQALLTVVFAGTAPQAEVISFAVGMRATIIVVNVGLGFAAVTLLLGTLRWRRMIELEQELVEHIHLPSGLRRRLARVVARHPERDATPPRDSDDAGR